MLGWLWAAVAGAEEPAEEVLVWGDKYARWRERYEVQTEVWFARPLTLYAEVNREVPVAAIQVRLVVSCDDDGALARWLHEANCEIEDVGLVAMPYTTGAGDDQVLREMDATLSGAVLQLQVSGHGKVPNVDLEGIRTDNERERLRLESLRQLVSRAILPFDLKIPTPVHDGMQWQEYESRMFSMNAAQGTRGGSIVANYLNKVDPEHFVIQSIGEGTVTNSIPIEYAVGDPKNPEFRETPSDYFHLELHGVALLDRATGIVSERVWSVRGAPTASSSSLGGGWSWSGRFRKLGRDERVDVGLTYVASRPDRDDGRPAWVALEP